MTRDEARAKCIEAMAERLELDGWLDGTRSLDAAADAFNALNRIVFVLPTEVTDEMISAAVVVLTNCGWTPYPSWVPFAKEALETAMAAAGGLTNPPEKKT